MKYLYKEMSEAIKKASPNWDGDTVWCKHCLRDDSLKSLGLTIKHCLEYSWPKCCHGYIMTIDSPNEKKN